MSWLGTDYKGRDMLSRLIWGCQRVLVWGDHGDHCRLCRRHADRPCRRLSRRLVGRGDLVRRQRAAVVPGDGALHPHHELPWPVRLNIVIAVTFASAPQIMRIVRGLVLDLKTRDYISAAQTRGEFALAHHAGRAPAQRARAADRRCLPAPRLHHDHHRHPGLPRPRPAAARSRLGPDDHEAAGTALVCAVLLHALIPALAVSIAGARAQPAGRRPARNVAEGLSADGQRLTNGETSEPNPCRCSNAATSRISYFTRAGRNPGGGRLQPDGRCRARRWASSANPAAASRPWRSPSCATWARTAQSSAGEIRSRAATCATMSEEELRQIRGSRDRHGLPGADGVAEPVDADRPAAHGGADLSRAGHRSEEALQARARDARERCGCPTPSGS